MAHEIDEGTAYGLPEGGYERDLVEVGRGTPGGEWLRRYWQPVALSSEATDLPKEVRILGEDLILFRDGHGRPGLLYPRCCHRGTTLLYGRVEKEGIRCCYHGWLFDTEGRCLDQPCEPNGGQKRHLHRQPWFRVEERYGIVFAYLGPPEHRPPLPRYDVLEDTAPDRVVHATTRTLQTGGPEVMDCNWVQTYENVADPLHAWITHGMISGPQLGERLAEPPDDVTYEPTELGMRSLVHRNARPDEPENTAVLELILPNVSIVPLEIHREDGRATALAWHLPIDDTHTKIFTVAVIPPVHRGFDSTKLPVFGGKPWHELDLEGHQRFPGDYEAQAGQGRITFHSEERLVSSDRGVLLFRKQVRRAHAAMAQGKPPGPQREMVVVQAGRYGENATAWSPFGSLKQEQIDSDA